MGSYYPQIEITCLRRVPTKIVQWRITQSVDHNQNPPPLRYFLVGYRIDEQGIAIVREGNSYSSIEDMVVDICKSVSTDNVNLGWAICDINCKRTGERGRVI